MGKHDFIYSVYKLFKTGSYHKSLTMQVFPVGYGGMSTAEVSKTTRTNYQLGLRSDK